MASQGPSVLRGTSHPRWFAPMAGLAAVVGLLGALAGHNALSYDPARMTQAEVGFGLLAIGVVAVIGLAVGTRREVIVDGDGVEAKGVRITWEEPHDFYYRGVSGTGMPEVDKVTVRAPDGRRIEVDNVAVAGQPNVRVPKAVEQYSTAANWPKIQAQLQAGETVAFGAITMTDKELRAGEAAYSLAKRVTLQIEQGRIKIGTEGKWAETGVRVDDVGNYPCLLKAIGQVAQALPPG